MTSSDNQKTVVMIVGMHRSGTSAVGQLLENIGFDFGGNLLEGIDNVNNRGFWEDREVIALDEHIFELLHTSWFDFERLPGKWWEDQRIKDLLGVAQTWYVESFDGEKPVGIKDPRFCRLLPFWKRVFSSMDAPVHVLFVFRHPAEVAASLRQRDSFSLQVGYLLWLSYTIDALYYSRNMDLSLLPYDALVREPEKTIKQLVQKSFANIPLPKSDIRDLARIAIDTESRHQIADHVSFDGEVQDDIQALAHELYTQLLESDAEGAKSLADKYRKRLYRLLDHHKGVLSALQATVRKQVEINQKLSEVGSGHTHALSVIHDKDRQLEENKSFIEKCLTEIGKKDSILANQQQELERHQQRIHEQEELIRKNGALWERFEEFQHAAHGREMKLAESLAYIEKCEAWIGELNVLTEDYQRLLAEQREYIERTEAAMAEQSNRLDENTGYIKRCEARIAEQDQWLAENKEYIARCESRVREQDEGLYQRDKLLGERLELIEQQSKELLTSHEQMKLQQQRLIDLGDELSGYEKTLSATKQTIEALDVEAASKQEAIITLDEQLAAKNVQCADLEQSLDGVKAQAIRLGHELQQALVLKTALEADHGKTQQKLTESGEALVQARNRIMVLEQESHSASISIAELQNLLASRDESLVERDAEIRALDMRVSDAYSRLSDNEAALAEASRTTNEKDREIAVLKALLAERDETITHQARTMQGQLSSIAVLSKDLEFERRKVSDHEAALAAYMKDIAAKSAEISRLESGLAAMTAEKSRLENLDALNRQRLLLQKKQIETLKAHAAALESELIAMRAKNESITRDLDRYRSWRTVRLFDKFERRD